MRPLEQTLTKVEALEFLALGMMLANKQIRTRFKPSMFSHPEFQRAAAGLLAGNGYGALQAVLRDAGVEWEIDETGPVPRIIEALERDGRFTAAIDCLNVAITNHTEHRKDAFVERLLTLADAIRHERQKVDDWRTAFEREEAARLTREAAEKNGVKP